MVNRDRVEGTARLVRENPKLTCQASEPTYQFANTGEISAGIADRPTVNEQDRIVGGRLQGSQWLVQFMDDSGRHLAERGELAGVNQIILRSTQFSGSFLHPTLEHVVRRLQRHLVG